MADIENAESAEELIQNAGPECPYLFEKIFDDSGLGEGWLADRRLKLLKMVDPVLKHMLRPGEKVLFITEGLRQNFLEKKLFGGLPLQYNRRTLIFTSKRIILMHLRSKKRLGRFLSEAEYGDLQEAKSSGLFGSLTLKFRNGKKAHFGKVNRINDSHLDDLFRSMLGDSPADRNKSLPDFRNLCPSCFTEIPGFPKACPSCKAAYTTPAKAALLSLILPGLGDIVLGSRLSGSLQVLTILLGWTVFLLARFYPRETGAPIETDVYSLLFGLLILHVGSALKSWHTAKKGVFGKFAAS